MQTEWVEDLNGWFRAAGADDGSPLVARALIGRQGGELERFRATSSRRCVDGVPHWFWAEKKPGESTLRRLARAGRQDLAAARPAPGPPVARRTSPAP